MTYVQVQLRRIVFAFTNIVMVYTFKFYVPAPPCIITTSFTRFSFLCRVVNNIYLFCHAGQNNVFYSLFNRDVGNNILISCHFLSPFSYTRDNERDVYRS